MPQANLGNSSYTSAQRAVSLTMGLASSLSLSSVAALAHGSMPGQSTTHPVWQLPSAATAAATSAQTGHFSWDNAGAITNAAGNPATPANMTIPGQFTGTYNSPYAIQHNPAASFVGFGGAAGPSTRDLNLASPTRSFVAGNLANFHELTIQIGGSQQVVTMDTRLTAAGLVAAQQVLANGVQTIKIGGSGTAVGGTVTLNNNLVSALDGSVGGPIGSLTIAQGVKVIDTMSQLSISGNLNNYGSLLTASATRGASDHIEATTIFNALGGSIGSYMGGGGLYPANPVLTGTNGIANLGTISSAGSLTLNAPVTYNMGVISAAGNVNLNTAELNNIGIIASQTGNINVANNAAVNINSAGGAFVAERGNINIAADNANVYVTGGAYYSKNLNLNAGSGNVDTFIGEVTGTVNADAACVHLNASADKVSLGNINATVDPLFTNDAGDLVIDGKVSATNGADLTILARGSIYSGKGNKGLDTSSKTGKGGNITLIAGALFTNDGVSNVTVTANSPEGGNIDFSSKNAGGSPAALTSIKTTGSGTSDSGKVTILAFDGTNPSGVINLSGTTIDTSTKGTGSYGDVYMVAGDTKGTSLSTGKIIGNNISAYTATPDIAPGLVYDQAGSLVSGKIGVFNPQNAGVSLAPTSTITAKGTLLVYSPDKTTLGAITAKDVSITTITPFTIAKTIAADTIAIDSFGANISLNANVGTATTQSVTIKSNDLLGKGVITSKDVTLTATGKIGAPTFNIFGEPIGGSYIQLKAQNLDLSSTGNAAIQALTDLTITNVAMGKDSGALIKGSGNITQTGSAKADTVYLKATKALSVLGDFNDNTGIGDVNHLTLDAGTTLTQGDTSGKGSIYVSGSQSRITAKKDINILGTIGGNSPFPSDLFIFSSQGAITVGNKGSIDGFFNAVALSFTNNGSLTGSFLSASAYSSIVNNGTINADTNISLSTFSSKGQIITGPGSLTTSSGTMYLNAPELIANGQVNGADVSISSTKLLTISGVDGALTPQLLSKLTIAATDITVKNSPGNNPFSNMAGLNSFIISAPKGTVTSPLQGMSAQSDAITGEGGTVSLTAKTLVYNGTSAFVGPFLLQADGSTSKVATSGQGVTLAIGTGNINISSNTAVGAKNVITDFKINAAGKSDPTINISTPGVLRIEDAATNFITSGDKTSAIPQTIKLTGTGGVAIKGNLSTLNNDGGYSNLEITTASKLPFVMDGTQTFANITNGQTDVTGTQGIAGNAVSIKNPAGLVIGVAGSQTTLFGKQSIFTNASLITNNGVLSSPTIDLLPAKGSVVLNNNAFITTPSGDLNIHSSSGSLTINNAEATANYDAVKSFTVYSVSGSVTLAGTGTGAIAPINSAKIDIQALKGTVALGTAADDLILMAAGSGGNGGVITIKAIALTTGSNGTIISAPTTNTGTTNAGNIDIVLSGTKTLNVGPNGIGLELNNAAVNPGGTISVKNGGGISIDTNSLDLTNQKAGTMNLLVNSVKGPVYFDTPDNLNLWNLNTLSITSGSTAAFLTGGAKPGANGFGSPNTPLNTAINLTIANAGAIDVSKAIPMANNLTLTATKGALILGDAPVLQVFADSTTGKGGSLLVTASGLTFTDHLDVFARATGAGDGGSVSFNLAAGTKALTIDGGGAGTVSIDVSNKSALGGFIFVKNGGNISADGSGLILKSTAFGTNTGANLTIDAKGLLFISNADQISNIGLHNVTLASNSKTPFMLQDAAPGGKGNGLNYGPSPSVFNADSVSVTNNGGNIDYNSAPTAVADPIHAHNISLTATGGAIIFKGMTTVAALSDPTTGDGGSISISSKTNPFGGGLTLDASAGKSTGNGGAVSVTITDTKEIDLSTSTLLQMNVAAGATGTSGGSISFNNGGNLIVRVDDTTVFGYGPVLKDSDLSLKANGILNVQGLSTYGASDFQTLSFISNSKNAFLLGGAPGGVNGIESFAGEFQADFITISNLGGSILNGVEAGKTNTFNASKTITLTALGSVGELTNPIILSNAETVNITAGAKGAINAFIDSSFAEITATAGGAVVLNGYDGDFTLANIKGSSIFYFQTDSASKNSHSTYLGTLYATAGDINIQTKAKDLTTKVNSSIITKSGNIYLQNLYSSMADDPQITFKAGTVVLGSAPAAKKDQGNVFISIGATPAVDTTTFGGGAFPATVNYTTNKTTLLPDIRFGTTTNPSGSITATDASDILTAENRILSFNTSSTFDATHILLESNVRITADPPRLAASPVNFGANSANVNLVTEPLPTSERIVPPTIFATNDTGLYGALSDSGLMSNLQNTRLFRETPANEQPLPSSSKQTLLEGATLLAPDADTVVNTRFGEVSVAAGAVVLVVSSESGLAVYDLHDNCHGAVAIRHEGKLIPVVPGRSAHVTHKARPFADVNPAQFVGYRKVKNSSINSERDLYEAEFEIMSMIRGLQPLQSLMASDSAKTRRAMGSMLKTAAILMNLYSGKEPFTLKQKPQVTAYAP